MVAALPLKEGTRMEKKYVKDLEPDNDETPGTTESLKLLWDIDPTIAPNCKPRWHGTFEGVTLRIANVPMSNGLSTEAFCFEVMEGKIGEIEVVTTYAKAEYFIVCYESTTKVVILLMGRDGQMYTFLRNGSPFGDAFVIQRPAAKS
jgi:hypothetical protein